ncbi:hypothetical protein Ancab_000071 [Ancistrocladus abbreviatus]
MDTGNFVLTDDNNQVAWQSFNEPRDTHLPAQTVGILTEINSRFSETSFSRGRFQMRLIPDGNLVLNTRSVVTDYAYDAYWMTGTNDPSDLENAGVRLVYNETGYMFVLRRNGAIFNLMQGNVVSTKDYYQRATLNFDGVFAWYYHPRNSSSGWVSFQVVQENICISINGELDSGACGYNNICHLGNDQRPFCKCPPGFSLLDPKNSYGSCSPNFKPQGCQDYEEEIGGYRIQEITNTDWPNSDYDVLPNFSAEDCKNSCVNDCFCALAILRDGTCWKKKYPLANGRTDISMSKVDVGGLNEMTIYLTTVQTKFSVSSHKLHMQETIRGQCLSTHMVIPVGLRQCEEWMQAELLSTKIVMELQKKAISFTLCHCSVQNGHGRIVNICKEPLNIKDQVGTRERKLHLEVQEGSTFCMRGAAFRSWIAI